MNIRTALRFPRRAHLRRSEEFKTTLSNGAKLAGRCFRLYFIPAPNAARLGVTVSKRVDKRAVVRNRIRRIVREVFRQLPELPPTDFVVVANGAAAGAANALLQQELLSLFQRALKRVPAVGTMPGA